jgi:hypothetical protein
LTCRGVGLARLESGTVSSRKRRSAARVPPAVLARVKGHQGAPNVQQENAQIVNTQLASDANPEERRAAVSPILALRVQLVGTLLTVITYTARIVQRGPSKTNQVSSLKVRKVIWIYTNADYCLVPVCTWNPTTGQTTCHWCQEASVCPTPEQPHLSGCGGAFKGVCNRCPIGSYYSQKDKCMRCQCPMPQKIAVDYKNSNPYKEFEASIDCEGMHKGSCLKYVINKRTCSTCTVCAYEFLIPKYEYCLFLCIVCRIQALAAWYHRTNASRCICSFSHTTCAQVQRHKFALYSSPRLQGQSRSPLHLLPVRADNIFHRQHTKVLRWGQILRDAHGPDAHRLGSEVRRLPGRVS